MFDYFRNVHVNEDNEYQRNSTKLTDPISVYFGNSFIVSKCIFLLNIKFYFAEITMNGEGVAMVSIQYSGGGMQRSSLALCMIPRNQTACVVANM